MNSAPQESENGRNLGETSRKAPVSTIQIIPPSVCRAVLEEAINCLSIYFKLYRLTQLCQDPFSQISVLDLVGNVIQILCAQKRERYLGPPRKGIFNPSRYLYHCMNGIF
jgi:hypothetical protein